MHHDITGIILAGGKSSRIGSNKALLEIGGKKIIEIIRDVLDKVFEKVILIANQKEEYGFLGLETFDDIYADKGPLSGIHSGIKNSETKKNFIISCDLPFVNTQMIEFLVENSGESKITIYKTSDGIQPLCGIYSKQCISTIEDILNEGIKKNYSVHNLIEKSEKRIIDIDKELSGFESKCFFNINTIEDYEAIKK